MCNMISNGRLSESVNHTQTSQKGVVYARMKSFSSFATLSYVYLTAEMNLLHPVNTGENFFCPVVNGFSHLNKGVGI